MEDEMEGWMKTRLSHATEVVNGQLVECPEDIAEFSRGV